ncbi:28866_t:CDS:2 [Gigaspora margarita]|uniref:28866_t:CDS:1 n=1 Tax=Gigaspora margarita TaxID=4874 RepID=A0ABM8VY01_GIGMA|nr:28866_t:CDS:2 [Gigaspora margarita]
MLQESIVDIDEDNGETKELYLTISPNGDFVVEFVLLQVLLPDESKLWRFKFRLYNVENPNKNDYLDLEDNERFSYRKLSEIATSKILEFTKEQSNLITSENKLSWSVAVSDKLYNFKKSYKSTVRLLAISCISKHDMTPKDHIYSEGSKMPGFITIFSINEDYSIGEILKLNEYGGIVKLFSKNGDKKMNKINQYIDNKETSEDNKNTDFKETKENNQNIDKFFLVILNVSGIHKYQFGQLNNKHAGNIQNLKYPKRIYNAIKFNSKLSARVNMKYILKCLNKHYFLVDTKSEGVQYMELYDLKTDQLVNTFKRQNLNSLNFIVDIPANFTISNNNKLLAYNSKNQVKLYLIECGLEIASIEIKTDEMSFDGYFRSNSFVIIVKNEEEKEKEFSDDKRIYDDLTSVYLKSKGDKKDFQTLSLEENFEDITDKKKWVIFDLDHKKNELDEYYYIFEPWLLASDKKETPRYSVYLDEKKEILLLIGSYTIQVWYDRVNHDQSKKRTLEFISVIDKNESKSEVKKIEYAIRRFKLSIQSKDSQSVIEIGSNDEIIYAAKEACYTLKYLNQIYHSSDVEYSLSLTVENWQLKFQEIVKQTRNIILRFIMLYPTAWRLLDFRFDLLSILIEAREYTLIKYILFNEKDLYNYYDLGIDFVSYSELVISDLLHEPSLHMPQYFSWGGETINTIFKAFEDDDPIYLGFLLEYYSIRAVEDIGWMITVGEIIPMLYNKNNKNYGIYKFYIQLLFYKPCFGKKKLDIPFFEFIKIPPTISNCSEVFIPITQLIPQESILKVEEISPDKIPYTQMVPLIDFASNNELSFEKRGNKYMNFLKSLFSPGEFVSPDEHHIPFLSLLYEVEHNFDDPFYYNPSMEAIMNFIWYSSKSYWPPIIYVFIIYFLSYSIISWMYIAHIQVVVSNGSKIVYTMAGEPENSFLNPFSAIIAVYNWDQLSLDTWGFWPLIILSIIGNIVFVIILGNVIVSFMSAAFENADKDGKRAVLYYQSSLIYEYMLLKNSAFISGQTDLDSKFKAKLRMKYICFYDDESVTVAWNYKCEKLKSIPIYSAAVRQRQMKMDEFPSFNECEFIWTANINDDNT